MESFNTLSGDASNKSVKVVGLQLVADHGNPTEMGGSQTYRLEGMDSLMACQDVRRSKVLPLRRAGPIDDNG
jgi:hypothetical protein